jgi:hypothetical protein
MVKSKVIDTEGTVINLSLNMAAREIVGDEVNSVRVRIEGDELMVLPSSRTKGIGNLPKGEQMIPLARSASGLRFSVPMKGIANGAVFAIEKLNYGWMKFTVAVGDVARGEPSARVVLR